jgi:hypothetical protein
VGTAAGRVGGVASFVLDSFEAHARILHPARGPDGDVRWAELAAPRGVDVGPETGFCAASGLDPARDQRAWDEAVPFTSTPAECLFCFWVGYGFFGQPQGLPLVRVPQREHYLFTGPLDRTGRPFHFDVWELSPTMWWPADRVWFVATGVDGYSTYASAPRRPRTRGSTADGRRHR